jgi:ABC-2 type transport system ATP-binding protein
MEVIRCQGLTKRYGPTVAVDGLDLVVDAGQVFGFLGLNGAGKTTTMRMLLGLVRPTSGRAWVNGRPLPDSDGLVRIGAMLEEPAFYPWLSGRRNLEVLALSGPRLPQLDAVDAALDRVGLAAVAHRRVKAYSQGMRQRLGLAAALLRRPALLLLDEPTNGMDPAGIRQFRALLRSLVDDHTTVFLSSHLLAEVEHVCDEVAVLHAGRLVEQGRVAELTAARARVRVVLDPADQPAARRLLAGAGWPLRSDGSGALLVEAAGSREVNQALGRGGVWARQLLVERRGLEEAFLRLTEADLSTHKATTEEVSDAAASR